MENNEEEVVIFNLGNRNTDTECKYKWDEFINRLANMKYEASFRHDTMTIERIAHWDSRWETLKQVIKIAKEMKKG